jgi:putative ABC transport system ATP-binding protein
MTSDHVLLEARDLSRRHPDGARWLLDGVSIAIGPGDRLAIVGASGSGKTLLLRSLARLDPLDRGDVAWQGRPLAHDRIPAFRSRAIYLHQRPAFGAATVEEALRQPFLLGSHRHRAFDRQRAIDLLARLGRDAAFLGKQVRDLSGGESQIAALTRAVQLDPILLMMDEPTAALDAGTERAAERLLLDWVAEAPQARAFVWVTHDAEQAARVATRIVEVHDGKLAAA